MPLRVLIVEDNPAARTALARLLALEGFLVHAVGTLREGMDRVEDDVSVLLDLDLPDGNGLELLRKVRLEERPVRVLVTTATVDAELLSDVERLEPDALLRKPLDVERLLNLLTPPTANPSDES